MIALAALNVARANRELGSCVVFGILKEAIKQGGMDKVLPLGVIADAVLSLAR